MLVSIKNNYQTTLLVQSQDYFSHKSDAMQQSLSLGLVNFSLQKT